MKGFGVGFKEKIKRVDPILFCCTTFLSIVSLLTLLGGMDNFGKSKLVMQLAMTVFGTVFIFILANFDYRYFVDRFYIVMFLASAFLLALTLLVGISGVGMETSNKSWLVIMKLGEREISIQPSEFVKLTFICTLAKHLDMVKDKINKPLTILGLIVHCGVIVGLILLSGDLGVSLVYMGIILVMLFCSGLSLWYFLGAGVLIAAMFPLIWKKLAYYQQQRIIVGFNPESDPLGYGMQPLMSKQAIENGGFFGRGLFGGSVYEDLAASHTDFIFASVCEKFGFVGGALVIIALIVLVVRIVFIAFRCNDNVGRLICFGVSGIIILQTLENIGMCMAMIPVIGITLPFMSAGGSSVLAMYMIVGLVHSVNAHEKKFFFSREL